MMKHSTPKKIETTLRRLAEVEKQLAGPALEGEALLRLQRLHKRRRAAFEALIPSAFRLRLRRLCQRSGINGDFF